MRATIPAIFCIAAGTFGYADGNSPATCDATFHSGVASAHGLGDSTSSWVFTEEQRYGGEDGSGAELVEPGTMGVDAAGRLYVADSKPVVIKVYNPNGTLLRTIGRQGGGPGEFRGAWIAVRGPHLIVHDPGQSRTTVFDTSGTYLRSWRSFCCHQNEITIDSANRVVVPAVVSGNQGAQSLGIRRISYARFRIDGTPIDTIYIMTPGEEKLWTVSRQGTDGKPASGYTSTNIPFTPRQLYALHPAGGFVTGWSGDYRIIRTTNGRDSTRLVARRWTPRPIPTALRQAKVDTAISLFEGMVGAGPARQAVRLADVPTTEPAFTRLLVDGDGNIWAHRLLGGDATHSAFHVFSPTGAYEGEAVLPVSVPEWGGAFFGRRLFYVRSEDADGRPIVVRFRVSRGAPKG